MNIAIFSGELSGDLIGGALAEAIRELIPDAELWGLGSGAMQAAGVELLADSSAWGAISITEAIVKVPGLLASVAPRLKRALRARQPDVVVLIDFGAFNVRAAQFSKHIGCKVCYYFPPGSWRRNSNGGSNLAAVTDLVITPFSWSAEQYQRLGAKAVNVGHPMLDRVTAKMTRSEFTAQFGMDASSPIIGLLPGSREHEISHLMPTLLEASRRIYRELPDAQFVVGVAPSISAQRMRDYLSGHTELRDRLTEIWHEFVQEAEDRVIQSVARTATALTRQRELMMVTQNGVLVPADAIRKEMEARRRSEHIKARAEQTLPPTVLAKGLTYDVMAHSDVVLTCSGTATLEAALFATPMVILYRGSKVMELEYRLRGMDKKIAYIGLPNILADRLIVPELIQGKATPEAIATNALHLLNDPVRRQQVRADLRSVRACLGDPGASARAAQLVVDLARQGKEYR